ncbi:MAG: hypothetical protein KDC98_05235, partial [Planctomycetes bacterium]|nr:hypothetical protein [Planctomycetota bacterium]
MHTSALLLFAAAAAAQGPVTLLADLESSGLDNPGAFSQPQLGDGVTFGAYLYFAADADGHGSELWRSDGSVGGASLVVDLNVGGGSEPKPIGVVGGWLLFLADDGIAGRELWRTDGTAAGTSLVKDVTPGPDGSQLDRFVSLNNRWWFTDGFDLWSTDGTTGNTIALPVPLDGVSELAASGNALWLLGERNGTQELWWTTGASLPNLAAQLPNGGAEGLVGLPGSRVVFAYDDGVNGTEPWTSDGTAAGTQMLLDVFGGGSGSGPHDLVAWNGEVWFVASDASATRLYRSNGTAAGTVVVDSAAGPRWPEKLTAAGNHLYFSARDVGAAAGWEPWVTDGTPAGTHMVQDIWPGSPTSGAGDFAYDGTQWTYFSAHDGVHGYELWRTDLTTTQLVSDIQPGFTDSSPVVLGFRGIYCLFAAVHTPNSFELFSSSGNSSQLVADIRDEAGGSSHPEAITPLVDGRFVCTATHPATGREPHGSNGQPGSGQLLVDTVGGTTSGTSYTTAATAAGDHVFFNSMPGGGLWRTGATPASTNAIPGVQAITSQFTTYAGKTIFVGRTGATGDEVYTLPDPLAAPQLLKDIVPGSGTSDPREFCVVGSRLLFVARSSGTGSHDLWICDGTTTGTQMVWQNGTVHEPQQLRALGHKVVFSLGTDLVVSDGTATGTVTIGAFYGTHERVVVGPRMFFAGYRVGANTGEELCVTDGTTVSLVADIRPG